MTALASIIAGQPASQISDHEPAAISRHGQVRDSETGADQTDFRQLRRLTHNVLQRIVCQITQLDELRRTDEGRLLCETIERQVVLTATIADALFGMTREPGPLPERLRSLSEAVMELMGDLDQGVELYVSAEGRCPAALEDTVLRVAHELLGNAVKHGMHGRVIGCICVDLVSAEHHTVLTVTDDGWGCGNEPGQGEGLPLAQLLAGEHGGTVRLQRQDRATIATLDLPHAVPRPGWTTTEARTCP